MGYTLQRFRRSPVTSPIPRVLIGGCDPPLCFTCCKDSAISCNTVGGPTAASMGSETELTPEISAPIAANMTRMWHFSSFTNKVFISCYDEVIQTLPWRRKTLFLSCITCAQFSSILTIVLVLTLSHKAIPVCVCILRPVEMLAGGNFIWGHFGTEGRVGWATIVQFPWKQQNQYWFDEWCHL